jgi:uncharacterized protein (TIGR03437 family)
LVNSRNASIASLPRAQSATTFGAILPYNYVMINGGDAIAVSDTLGNSTGLVAGSGSLFGTVPSVSQARVGPRISLLDLPTQGSYTISFTTTTEPLVINMFTGSGSNIVQAVRYIDLTVAPGLPARLIFSTGAVGSLQLDTNLDGTFKTSISPTLSTNGTLAQDITAPTISFILTGQSLAISAMDTGSGVKDLFYSLDGTTYLPYGSAVNINPATVNVVYAFADDNAGNRGASSYVVSPTKPAINAGGVVSSATFAVGGAVSPGSIASVFGSDLNSSSTIGTSLYLDGIGAPLFGVFPQQVNFQVPWELSGQSSASLTLENLSSMSAPITVQLASYAPGIFSMNASGSGQGAIVDALTGQLAAASNAIPGISSQPITRGRIISIYCTGMGPVSNQPATGVFAPITPLANTTTQPLVSIGGVSANQVSYSGLAPGFFGLYQINVQVPNGVSTGTAIPVSLSIGGVPSNTVTIAVQ